VIERILGIIVPVFLVVALGWEEPGKVAAIVLVGNLLAIAFVPLGLALALR
jgi:hypothetical protein